jgi:hypothetical protein
MKTTGPEKYKAYLVTRLSQKRGADKNKVGKVMIPIIRLINMEPIMSSGTM